MKENNNMNKDQTNETNNNQASGAECCSICSNHCPKDALSCGRGRRFFEETQGVESVQEEKERSEHSHGDYERSGAHGEGRGRGDYGAQGRGCGKREKQEHGSYDFYGSGEENHGRHRGRERFHKDEEHDMQEMDMDDLGSLMRACGHFLYHSAGERNGQGRIMHILASKESISQKELQDQLGIQAGSISEILAKLEMKGLILREKDSEDKRKTIVSITEAGKLHVIEYRKNKGHHDKFAALSEEQKKQLKELLSVLLESWR